MTKVIAGHWYQVGKGSIRQGQRGIAVAPGEVGRTPGTDAWLVSEGGLFCEDSDLLSPADEERIPESFFLKTHWGTYYGNSGAGSTMLELAVTSYGHVLPLNRVVLPAEFAVLVERYYSITQPNNRAVVEFLRAL